MPVLAESHYITEPILIGSFSIPQSELWIKAEPRLTIDYTVFASGDSYQVKRRITKELDGEVSFVFQTFRKNRRELETLIAETRIEMRSAVEAPDNHYATSSAEQKLDRILLKLKVPNH